MKTPKFIPEFKDVPSPRQKMPELPVEERSLNFNEVELGFSEEDARQEASRCLSCRRCIGCGLCLAECDQEAVVYDETARETVIEGDAIIFAPDADTFDAGRKGELNYCKEPNVITSLELERLLSATGPFGGLVLRPSDGDVPRKIAFIQCVGSREEGIGANYCSAECCTRTLSQAKRVKETAGEVEVSVFHRGLRPIGKYSEIEIEGLKNEKWIDFIEAEVSSAAADDGGKVAVTYRQKDEERSDTFDLVVLAVGLKSKRDFRTYARTAGMRVNKFGFVDRTVSQYITGADGISLAGSIYGPAGDDTSIVDAIAAVGKVLDSCRPSGRTSRKQGEGTPVVYVCEYGLHLAGMDGKVVENLKAKGLPVAGSFPFLCYKNGREAIEESMHEASRLVVVACHSNSHEELFETMLGRPEASVVILDHRDLDGDVAQAVSSLLDRVPRVADRTGAAKRDTAVAIVGGGISGLAAAGELLRRGNRVVIIEKSDTIGGRLEQVVLAQGGEPEVVEGFLENIKTCKSASILNSTEVKDFRRKEDMMTLTLATPEGEQKVEVGSLLLATGSAPYIPDEYPYGEGEKVLTQSDLSARIMSDEVPWKRVVMIQCVGARDPDHRYCSRYCCKQALDNAIRYKQKEPNSEITVLHRGIRVFGFEEELYTEAIEMGVDFIEIEGRPTLEVGGTVKIKARMGDGSDSTVDCDAVVLSVAHCHGKDQEELARIVGASLDEIGFFLSPDTLGNPFATSAEGVFVCGLARAPVTAEEAYAEGVGAAAVMCEYLNR